MPEAKASAKSYFDLGWKLWLDRKETDSAAQFERAFDAASGNPDLRSSAFDAAAYMTMRTCDGPKQFDAFLNRYRPLRADLPSFVVFEAASHLAAGQMDGFWRACAEMPVHDPATMGPWNRGCTTIPRQSDWLKRPMAEPMKLPQVTTICEPDDDGAFEYSCVFSSDNGYFAKFAAFSANSFNHVEQPMQLHYHIINPNEASESLARELGERWGNIRVTAETIDDPQRAYYASRRFILANDVLKETGKPVFVFDLDLILRKPLTQLLSDPEWHNDRIGLRVSPKLCLPWQKCTVNLLYLPANEAGQTFADTMAKHLRQAMSLSHLGDIWWVDQNAALVAYLQSDKNDLQYWGARAKDYCEIPGLFQNRSAHLSAAAKSMEKGAAAVQNVALKPAGKPAEPVSFPRGAAVDLNALLSRRPFNYLANWSAKGRFVYVETPKVGCTTVKRVLQTHEVDGDMSKLHKDVHNKAASPLKSPSDDRAKFQSLLDSPDVLRFCFVRNPFLRVLSAYLDKMVENAWERKRLAPKLGFDVDTVPDFEAFLDAVSAQKPEDMDIHWAPQAYLLQPNVLRYDMIGRFETFQRDFISVCQTLGVKIPDTLMNYGKRHATGAAERSSKFMTPSAVSRIQTLYEEDFLTFGYGWAPPLS